MIGRRLVGDRAGVWALSGRDDQTLWTRVLLTFEGLSKGARHRIALANGGSLMGRALKWFFIVAGLVLFAAALIVGPQGVLESVWTGMATGLFTTGLVEIAITAIRSRERAEEVRRRENMVVPLDYSAEGGIDVALDNIGGDVAVHVVLETKVPERTGLIEERLLQRAIRWAPVTFEQAVRMQEDVAVAEELDWRSGRQPIEFEYLAPGSRHRVRIRRTASDGQPDGSLELPVRFAWSVPGDPRRYLWELSFKLGPVAADNSVL